MDRPIKEEDNAIRLFATNMECDIFNADCLFEMSGPFKSYKSTDTGDTRLLQRILAPKELQLKNGCPVMILRNLGKNVVNGMMGTVVAMTDDAIHVKSKDGRVISCQRVAFSRFRRETSTNVATRLQFPLKPAFGLTVHKSQGKIDLHIKFI